MSTATLTIDLDAIAANWRALDRLTGPGVESGAVVKADCYGLGAARVAPVLARAGVRRFFVAVAEEAAAIRSAIGPDKEICIFSGHMSGDTDLISQLRLTPMLNSPEQFARHRAALPGHAFGVQLDTGMNRLGFEPAEWAAVAASALAERPVLLMSHLACADEPGHPLNARQLAVFHAMTDGTGVARSLSATGGILLGAEYHFDVTRPGIGLYGGAPFEAAHPVARLSVPVVQTRPVARGETVGYATGWTADRDSIVATIASGYADGLIRRMSGRARAFSGEAACPLIGRVSMDLITVDITDLGHIPDRLDLLCPAQGVDDLAQAADTIGYEILTSLGNRYRRVYQGDAA